MALISRPAGAPQVIFPRPTSYRTLCRTHWALCISAPPPDLALLLLMFGFVQMAGGKKPRTSCGLCPNYKRKRKCTNPLTDPLGGCAGSLLPVAAPDAVMPLASAEVENRQPESRTQAGAELPPPAFVQHVLQHAPCSTVTCEQGIQRVLGTRVTDPWWLLPPQTHLYEIISA